MGIDDINELMRELITGNLSRVMEMTDAVLFQGVPVEQFIIDLTEYFRNLLFLRHGVVKETLLGFSPQRFFPDVAEAFSVPQLELAVEILLQLFRDIRFSLNQRFELELALSRLAGLRSYLTPGDMLAEIQSLREKLQAGDWGSPAGEIPGKEGETPQGPPPFNVEAVKTEILNFTRKRKLTLSSALEKALRWSHEGEELFLFFSNDFTAGIVREERVFLSDKILEISGHKLKLNIQISAEEERPEGRASGMDEPVETVKKVFRGEIIQGESNESF